MAKLQKLSSRAKLKGLSQYIAYSLYYTCTTSNLRRSYRNSIYCQDILIATDNTLKSTYCKNRWCPSCNRIRTANYMTRYLPVLESQKELYFVTLTRPNVVVVDLRAEIKELLRLYRCIVNGDKIIRNLIKSTNTIGLRKLECTYNPQRDDYHPHLHLLVSNRLVADAIVTKWLKLSPTANRDAQCVKPVTELAGGVKEIFKYFSKLLARTATGRVYFDAVHMDAVFVACRGVQIYGGLGSLKINDIDDEADGSDNVGVSGVYKYRDMGNYIGYYSIDEADNSNLIEVAKPRYLRELES